MGVYFPGLIMPRTCQECDPDVAMLIECEEWMNMGAEFIKKRAHGCPLVEIKEPHGRLVDIDALMKESGMARACIECESNPDTCEYVRYSRNDICDWIDNAPVVIEAEGEYADK